MPEGYGFTKEKSQPRKGAPQEGFQIVGGRMLSPQKFSLPMLWVTGGIRSVNETLLFVRSEGQAPERQVCNLRAERLSCCRRGRVSERRQRTIVILLGDHRLLGTVRAQRSSERLPLRCSVLASMALPP